MSRFAVALFAVALSSSLACSEKPSPAAPGSLPPAPAATATEAHAQKLVHLSDDADEAKKMALAAGKIVVVDAWAPWCHTCWSMKREVLHDPSLEAYADRVLFVEIDTDKPQNAAFVVRYPVRTWPTFFALDPANGVILQSHGGSMSLVELRAFLDRALALHAGSNDTAQDRALAAGYGALQSGDPKKAAEQFMTVQSGPRRTEAIFAAVRALREAKDFAHCAQLASTSLDVVEGSAAGGDLASFALICSDELPKDDAQRTAARAAAQKKLEQLVASPATGAAVDDKADVMINLADVYEEAGRADDAKKLHEQRIALLEADAAAAKTPEAERTHDYARMNSYLALGRGDDAVALFKKRIAQFPEDYEAYARLASTLHKLKRDDDALPVAQDAVRLSYGPRKIGYLKLLADIHAARGDKVAERTALQDLVTANEALPVELRKIDAARSAQQRLAQLQ